VYAAMVLVGVGSSGSSGSSGGGAGAGDGGWWRRWRVCASATKTMAGNN